jgi:peptide deformylase
MAIRNIVKEGDPILRKICRSVINFDDRLASLLDDMAETMHAAEGVGLAGPQVGMLKRVAVVDVGDGLVELVNPVIIETDGSQDGSEGCLSSPGEYGMVCRPYKVTVRAQDRFGKSFTITGEGLKARAFGHEIDHLNGILFKDKMSRKVKVD